MDNTSKRSLYDELGELSENEEYSLIKSLDERDRKVICLFYGLDGNSKHQTKDIAKIVEDVTGKKPTSVRMVLGMRHRALRKMRSVLRKLRAPKHKSGIHESIHFWGFCRRFEWALSNNEITTIHDLLKTDYSTVRRILGQKPTAALIAYLAKYNLRIPGSPERKASNYQKRLLEAFSAGVKTYRAKQTLDEEITKEFLEWMEDRDKLELP